MWPDGLVQEGAGLNWVDEATDWDQRLEAQYAHSSSMTIACRVETLDFGIVATNVTLDEDAGFQYAVNSLEHPVTDSVWDHNNIIQL